jgi:lipopolysaccharide/colanic/teichoic acid biosynthesis glycosyltransferase
MRRYPLLLLDVLWMAASPLAALFLRDNFELSYERLSDIAPYIYITAAAGFVVFLATGAHRGLWRYSSLQDLLRVVAAATLTILIAQFLAFDFNRLEGLPRSLPAIQWLVVIAALAGTRVGFRLVSDLLRPGAQSTLEVHPQWPLQQRNVLIVGLSRCTELYLRAVAEHASEWLFVAGILVEESSLHGREIKLYKVLGDPKDLCKILAQYETHGVTIDRIVLAVPFRELSPKARDALDAAEDRGIRIDVLVEQLDLIAPEGNGPKGKGSPSGEGELTQSGSVPPPGNYSKLKRITDFTAAIIWITLLAPVIILVALVVAMDVGWPVVFWQQRPGRYGKNFKLYKFRTMSRSHDADGARIPDELRLSRIGALLRRFRMDELPQLYNILVGEMSFVGPRPLLAKEQENVKSSRLAVRPGLTGWAQISGGRTVTVQEKTALDAWYVKRMSLTLDVRIVIGTLGMLIRGDQPDDSRLRAAMEEFLDHANDGVVVTSTQKTGHDRKAA